MLTDKHISEHSLIQIVLQNVQKSAIIGQLPFNDLN